MTRREEWDDQLERNPYRDLDERSHRAERPDRDDGTYEERRPGLITRIFTAIGAFIENILSLGHSRDHSPRFSRNVTNVTTLRHINKSNVPFVDEADWLRDASGRRTFKVNSLDELPPEIRRLAEEALREANEKDVNRHFEYESRETEASHDHDPDALVTLNDPFDDGHSSHVQDDDVHRTSKSVRREVRIVNGHRTERIVITDDDGRERAYDSIDDVPESDRRWLRMIEDMGGDDRSAFDEFDR